MMNWPTQFTFGEARRRREAEEALRQITESAEERRLRTQREEEENMATYFQEIIHFKDGDIIEVNCATKDEDDDWMLYHQDDDEEELFLKVAIDSVKYITVSEEMRLTKDVEIGFRDITDKQRKKRDKEVEGKASRLKDID